MTNNLQLLNAKAQMISEQLERVDSGIMEVDYLKNTLDELKQAKENTDILSPLSSGIFVKAKMGKTDKLLVNVGNGVVVEKTIEETKALLDEKINEMTEARENLIHQMQHLQKELEKEGVEQCLDS